MDIESVEPGCCFVNEVERYGRQETIRTAPNRLIKAHDLFGMRARNTRPSIAEDITGMDVKKRFRQCLFSVFNSTAKVALLVMRLQHLH